jgi:hypothetical protein
MTTNANLPKKRIIVEDMGKSGHCYVINTSDFPDSRGKGRRDKGQVIIPIVSSRNQQEKLIVFNSWVPQDLCEQMPFEEFVNSTGFRTSISTGVLKYVDDEEAEKLLNSRDAVDEVNRLKFEYSRAISGARELEEEVTNTNEVVYNPIVFEAIDRDDLEPAQRFSILKNNEGRLSADDWKYIMEKSTDDRILRLAKTNLEK